MAITIRLATASDAESIGAIYAPLVRESAISFEYEPPSTEEMCRRIANTLAAYPWVVCEADGAILGYAYAASHRARAAYQWSVETSIFVAADSRRRGVGRGLYESLFEILVLQGFHNAYAGITLPNPASVRLHEASGFEPVGIYRSIGYKFGAWHDVGWWQRRLKSDTSAPTACLKLAKAHTLSDWPAALNAGIRFVK